MCWVRTLHAIVVDSLEGRHDSALGADESQEGERRREVSESQVGKLLVCLEIRTGKLTEQG